MTTQHQDERQSVVYIVDDEAEDRAAVAAVLAAHGMASRQFRGGDEFLGALDRLSPSCIVMDLRMPGIDGMSLVEMMGRIRPHWPVVMVSGHANVPLAVRALQRGAADFIEKPFTPDELMKAVNRAFDIMQGRFGAKAAAKKPSDLASMVTPRELDVLRHLLAGRQNKAIAYHLDISERTVEVHRAKLMKRLGVRSFAELIRKAVEHGMAEVPPTPTLQAERQAAR